MWWVSMACSAFWNLCRVVSLWSSVFWTLVGFKLKSEPLSVYSFSGCFLLSLCSSLDLSQPLSVSTTLSSSHAQTLMVFSLLSLLFCFSLHTYAALSRLLARSLSRSVFPLFFPPLSPGNQTSGEECWVSTFPEKRTIWGTQRPTMDPLCSLLPSLCCCTAAHTHTET